MVARCLSDFLTRELLSETLKSLKKRPYFMYLEIPMLTLLSLLLMPLLYAAPADLAGSERANPDTVLAESESPPWVRYVGNRRAIMKQGDLSARIALNSLAGVDHLYALGPVEGLRGEVTIYDGMPSITTLSDDAAEVSTAMDAQAIFLVYGAASEWTEVPVSESITGLEELEAFVRLEAETVGLDLETPFPFRIEGAVDTAAYHVIWRTDDRAMHNHAAHQKAKRMFELSDEPVRMVGFWLHAGGEGVYTHPGMRTHVHIMNADNTTSGHLDDLTLPAGATLYLPLPE